MTPPIAGACRHISFHGPREALTAAQDHAPFPEPARLQAISESSAFEDLQPPATLAGLPRPACN